MKSRTDLHFLLVDDDESVLKTVQEYLESFGYKKVLTARDGEEALRLTEKHSIDFIITDWEMPKLNGIEFLKTVRAMEGKRDIPYIIITSPTSQERLKVEEAAHIDVSGYIIKPFRSTVLKDKIEEVLAKREAHSDSEVLVVDDDDDVRETVADILKSMGYAKILYAKNGMEAFRLLKQSNVTLVISDWEMPELSGIELLRKIRQDSVLSDLPFIMVTSQTSKENLKVQQAIQAEVDHYLMKPFTIAELKSKVRNALKKVKSSAQVGHLLQDARNAANSGEYEKAKHILADAIRTNPKNLEAYYSLAELLLDHGQSKGSFEEAVYVLKKAIEMHPNFERGYLELSSAFERKKSLELSIKYLKEGLVHCVQSDQLHCRLGLLLLKVGKSQLGYAELQNALDLNPNNEEAAAALKARD